ncbi:MAG: CidA/LrgA family protein [Proteocatella sp.]
MKILMQFGIVFGICWIGEIIAEFLPFTFPASVISMVLLLALLLTNLLRTDHIREKSDFLLKNMAFFFVPSGVAIMDKLEFVQGNVLKLVLICFITFVITFVVTAYTVSGVIRFQDKMKGTN